jgi:class 3 adenylate cyclase
LILLSNETAEKISSKFTLHQMGLHRLRGKREELEIYRLTR